MKFLVTLLFIIVSCSAHEVSSPSYRGYPSYRSLYNSLAGVPSGKKGEYETNEGLSRDASNKPGIANVFGDPNRILGAILRAFLPNVGVKLSQGGSRRAGTSSDAFYKPGTAYVFGDPGPHSYRSLSTILGALLGNSKRGGTFTSGSVSLRKSQNVGTSSDVSNKPGTANVFDEHDHDSHLILDTLLEALNSHHNAPVGESTNVGTSMAHEHEHEHEERDIAYRYGRK